MEIIIILTSLFFAAIIPLVIKHRGIIELTSIFASTITFIASILIAVKVSTVEIYSPYVFFSVNALGAIIMLIITLIGLITTIYSVAYLREEMANHIIGFTRIKQYFILLNLFLMAMILAVSSSNPIITWISVEATTLSTAFLISFYNKPSALEGAWKYLTINSVGLLLGFFGTLLYLTSLQSSGNINFVTWNNLLLNAGHLDPSIAKIAFIFILIGYGTKVGLAPMHTWLPDAHSKAPAPISALLSGVLLNVALFVVLRYKIISDVSIGSYFSQNLFIIFGLFSISVAALIIFTQKNYKRLLAYSSIENMGIIVLGFGFGGLGVLAAILHMIYHSLIKPALFFLSGNIFLRYKTTKIINIQGIISSLPITGIFFILGFFIITGAPPFGIFLTKLFIFSEGIQKHLIITIITIALTALVFVGFFKHINCMMFGEKPKKIKKEKENIWLLASPIILILIAFYLSFHIPLFLNKLLTMATAIY